MVLAVIACALRFSFVAKQLVADPVLSSQRRRIYCSKFPEHLLVELSPSLPAPGTDFSQRSVGAVGVGVGAEKYLFLVCPGPVLIQELVKFQGGIGPGAAGKQAQGDQYQ